MESTVILVNDLDQGFSGRFPNDYVIHIDGIVPCGIEGHGVTSLVDLGLPVEMGDLDVALRRTFGGAMG
jgi:lipoate-protein ligase B